MSDKSDFIPKDQRKGGHALLDITDVEFLARLVDKGEGLMLSSLKFGQAEALLRTGHAEVAGTYTIGDEVITRIQPTELGRTLIAIREKARLARLETMGTLPPPKEKP